MAQLSPLQLLERKLDQQLKKAIYDYDLVDEGDHILLGLSGGKDSLALVELLGRRMRIFAPRFRVTAVHVSMSNIPYQSDLKYLEQHAANFDIPFVHRVSSFDPSTDKRKSPCFLCSWTRRKALFELAKELGCTKIALGHHQDDILQTLLMNLTYQGAFGTMPPRLKMSKFDMTIIRPMCLMSESDLLQLAKLRDYREQKKSCPYESSSSRPDIKQVLSMLEQLNPEAKQSLWRSMSNIQTDYLPQIKQQK